MDEGAMLTQNEDGEWEKYDGTYDVVIHCDSKEDQQKVVGMLKNEIMDWIPISERLPDPDEYILLSFENYTMAAIGRYERNEDGGGNFYEGDEERTLLSFGLYVNAWMPLPEPYKQNDEGAEK